MEQLKAKLKKQGGFTLVELLIVVAIIAVLVAVSIPMMNSALEKSRHAVDQANVRDAIALVSMKYLTDPKEALGVGADESIVAGTSSTTWNYVVDANHQGTLSTTETGVSPQCTCSATSAGSLTVTITAPAAGAEVPNIKASWKFEDGKTVPNS